MMERVLITGADGFVASHLITEIARELSCDITGIGLKDAPLVDADCLDYTVLDLTDYEALKELLDDVRPDSIFHLAALPSVHLSWEDPWSTYRVNVLGQVNLMEALRRLDLEASVHIACSSEEYGKVPPEEMPMLEDTPFNPCSHYAVSKVAQEVLGLMYYQAFGWRVMVTRGFNQAGPGQAPDFVISSFARQIAEIEAPGGGKRFHGRARHSQRLPDDHGKRRSRRRIQRMQRRGPRGLRDPGQAARDLRSRDQGRA
jgi:GDP-4-dehydro-6-deoxy-D-mannose reductase